VCGGKNCEAWHDDADMVVVILELDSGQELPMVMTTWHSDEPEEEVVFFAFNLTNFDQHDFRKYLVLRSDTIPQNGTASKVRFGLCGGNVNVSGVRYL
jgi:hypothetical protein